MSEHQEIIDELWNEYHDMYSIQHAATPKEINELRDSIEELFSDDLFMSNINKDELAQLEELRMLTFSENCVEEEAEEPNGQCHQILVDIDADLVIIPSSPWGIQDDVQRIIDNLNELYDDDLFMSSLNSDDTDWMESLMKDAEALYASFSENNYVEKEADEPNAKPSLTYFEQLLGILLGASCMAIIVWLFIVITILAFGE